MIYSHEPCYVEGRGSRETVSQLQWMWLFSFETYFPHSSESLRFECAPQKCANMLCYTVYCIGNRCVNNKSFMVASFLSFCLILPFRWKVLVRRPPCHCFVKVAWQIIGKMSINIYHVWKLKMLLNEYWTWEQHRLQNLRTSVERLDGFAIVSKHCISSWNVKLSQFHYIRCRRRNQQLEARRGWAGETQWEQDRGGAKRESTVILF